MQSGVCGKLRCSARTDGGFVQLFEDVALVLVVGNVEALLGEQPGDAIGVEVTLVQERRHAVSEPRRWCSACLGTVCQRCAADIEPMQRALTLWTKDETAAGRRVRERNIIVYGVGGDAAGWSRACPVVVRRRRQLFRAWASALGVLGRVARRPITARPAT